MRQKGSPPASLTGQLPTSPEVSPWWDGVCDRIEVELANRVMRIEDIAIAVGGYPGGGAVRPRTAVRRLAPILRLEERGPNGSKSRGAIYTIVPRDRMAPSIREDIPEDEVQPETDWLMERARRMAGED